MSPSSWWILVIFASTSKSQNNAIECHDNEDCVINCDSNSHADSCRNSTIYCPTNAHCDIVCNSGECEQASIQCPINSTCNILCHDESACKGLEINATDSANLALTCSAIGTYTCTQLSIYIPCNLNGHKRANLSFKSAAKTRSFINNYNDTITFYAVNGWDDINIINLNEHHCIHGTMHCEPQYTSTSSCQFASDSWKCSPDEHICNNPNSEITGNQILSTLLTTADKSIQTKATGITDIAAEDSISAANGGYNGYNGYNAELMHDVTTTNIIYALIGVSLLGLCCFSCISSICLYRLLKYTRFLEEKISISSDSNSNITRNGSFVMERNRDQNINHPAFIRVGSVSTVVTETPKGTETPTLYLSPHSVSQSDPHPHQHPSSTIPVITPINLSQSVHQHQDGGPVALEMIQYASHNSASHMNHEPIPMTLQQSNDQQIVEQLNENVSVSQNNEETTISMKTVMNTAMNPRSEHIEKHRFYFVDNLQKPIQHQINHKQQRHRQPPQGHHGHHIPHGHSVSSSPIIPEGEQIIYRSPSQEQMIAMMEIMNESEPPSSISSFVHKNQNDNYVMRQHPMPFITNTPEQSRSSQFTTTSLPRRLSPNIANNEERNFVKSLKQYQTQTDGSRISHLTGSFKTGVLSEDREYDQFEEEQEESSYSMADSSSDTPPEANDVNDGNNNLDEKDDGDDDEETKVESEMADYGDTTYHNEQSQREGSFKFGNGHNMNPSAEWTETYLSQTELTIDGKPYTVDFK